ncbi:L,D-transpeptidase family protein [Segetibacter koreensis]|uniref:L,D-transpeptidase family protein n=1 Tax=Segetibacter koreensis TaxID=398037 RepID=UPI000371B401|nr:L,D-transpeptidase family protein [Segetibacter koreensis]
MKRFIAYLTLILIFAACKNNKNDKETTNGTDNEKTENTKKITKRDYSINSSNSYSDLFLDSTDVENFIAEKKLNDTLTRRIRSFYNARNYQYAWFASDGVTEQGRSFWNLHQYYTTYNSDTTLDDKALKKKMNALVSVDTLSVKASDKSIANTEITLTEHFIQYILDNYKSGEIKRKELERFVPFKKEEAMSLADSLLTKKHKDNKYYSDVNPAYKFLKDQLQKYFDIAKKGGWQSVDAAQKKIKKGDSSLAISAIKKRLQMTGEMPAGDTTQTFDDQLARAVKTFQISHGLTPDAIITPSLIKEMNVPALKRVEQLLINMGRMRWMLNHTEGNLITVNLPEFVLHVYEGKNKVFDMNVVVGKEGHNTTIFTGNLNQIVFSPYWNIPSNIVEKEILPAMENDPDYLSKNEMEEVGEPVDGIPVIRQLPGPKNSLGKVKFLFPNSYDIYFHDTPAKSLFNKDKRAYSHGCIRLSDPVKMANYLLRNQKEWTPEKIEEAMNSGEEQFVKLKNPIPVLITYYTAWVDEKGMLNFRDDIYGHDANLIQKMFTNPL